MPELANNTFLHETSCHDLSDPSGADGIFVEPTPVAGGSGFIAFPANVALVVSWHEAISYRGGHPRTYLPGIPSGASADPQHVLGSYAAGVQTAANAFLAGINGAAWPTALGASALVVVHYHLHHVVLDPPVANFITAATVNTRIDSQRRRLQA